MQGTLEAHRVDLPAPFAGIQIGVFDAVHHVALYGRIHFMGRDAAGIVVRERHVVHLTGRKVCFIFLGDIHHDAFLVEDRLCIAGVWEISPSAGSNSFRWKLLGSTRYSEQSSRII